ncbi:hypothetical protein V6N13_047063 [Hibiscus sabdariffa]|uniref:Uncharacterized protein n=1 Tax=Hibiscus sabdariffa TaxID=183260 RepID=A0ABR2CAD0_9ROSI
MPNRVAFVVRTWNDDHSKDRVEIGSVYGVDSDGFVLSIMWVMFDRKMMDIWHPRFSGLLQLLEVIFHGWLMFFGGQLSTADNHRGWSIDFFCFGQNLHSMICGALTGKLRKVSIWTEFIYRRHMCRSKVGYFEDDGKPPLY